MHCFCLGTPFSQTRPWRVNYLSWQKTQGKEQEENLKMNPSLLHDCQNNPMGMNELQAKPESCSLRKSNPSWWVVVHWMRELQLFPWWSPGCMSGRIQPVISSLYRSVFKWCIKEYPAWSLTSTESCWPARAPIGVVVLGESRPLLFQCFSSLGQSSEVNSFRDTSLAIEVHRAPLICTNVEDLAHHSCRHGWH